MQCYDYNVMITEEEREQNWTGLGLVLIPFMYK